MKKIALILTSIFASLGNIFSQILEFAEVPDSLNPFVDLDISNINYWSGQVRLADIDSNGELEVVLYQKSYSNAHYLFQKDGDGVFQSTNIADSQIWPTVEFLLDITCEYCFDAELNFIDFDDDGDNDIVVDFNLYQYIGDGYYCNSNSIGRLRFYENNGNQDYLFIEELILEDQADVSFVDIDDDGDTDFVSHFQECQFDKYDYSSEQVPFHRVYEKINDTLYYQPSDFTEDFSGFRKKYIYEDIDLDGDFDALYQVQNDSLMHNELWWKERLGPNSFASDTLAPISWINQPRLFENSYDFGDIDNDGLLEYVEYDKDLHKVRLFKEIEVISSLNEIEEQNLNDLISVYPNPSSGMLNFSAKIQPRQLRIFSTKGQRLPVHQVNTNQLDLSDYKRGMYIIEFHFGEGVIRKKVLKE